MEHLNTVPTTAYDLLELYERQAVDDYVVFVTEQQHHRRQRIALALQLPIPSEYVRRSKGVLAKPLVRAAIAERIKEAASEQDLSPDRIIAEHAALAFSNVADYIYQGQFGEFFIKNIESIPRSALAAVKKMETIPTMHGMRTSVVLHDKQPSLKTLTELTGLVAPDRPPVLGDYVKPQAKTAENGGQEPETAYAALLESNA